MKKVFNKKNLKWLGVLILIISTIVMLCLVINTNKENEKLKVQITQLEKENHDVKYNNWYLMEENARINMINQDMWELYYSMVTEYNGEYEYYE
jgi:uncharacterized membrane protein